MASCMCMRAHVHHTVAMKTSYSVVEDMTILYIMTISYDRQLMQCKNQLLNLKLLWHYYVTYVQWSMRYPVILVTDLMGV